MTMRTLARAEYLASVPPGERSEAAARYDHQIEADKLATTPLSGDEVGLARFELRRQAVIQVSVDRYGTPGFGYRDGLERFLSGHVPPGSGLARNVAACEAVAPRPTDEQVTSGARLQRQNHLDYLLARYGVSPRVSPNA